MNLLLKKTNLIFIIFTFLFTSSLPVSADRLSTMVEGAPSTIVDSLSALTGSEDVNKKVKIIKIKFVFLSNRFILDSLNQFANNKEKLSSKN